MAPILMSEIIKLPTDQAKTAIETALFFRTEHGPCAQCRAQELAEAYGSVKNPELEMFWKPVAQEIAAEPKTTTPTANLIRHTAKEGGATPFIMYCLKQKFDYTETVLNIVQY